MVAGRTGNASAKRGGDQPLTRAQAIAGEGNISDTDPSKDRKVASAEQAQVEIDGRRQYFELQERWSEVIIDWITALLLFNCVLIVMVGSGLFTFEKTPWLITTFVTEIFLQVIGLGYIAARFLFPGTGSKSPKRKVQRSREK